MIVTDVQLSILRARFPHIGEPTLRRNAEQLLSRPFLTQLPPPSPPPAQKPLIAAQPPKAKKPKASRVPRTRNGGTITEAAFWGMLRSALRRTFRFWKPAIAALHAARVPCKGANGQKWAYVCADCRRLFPRKQVQIDHIEPAGALTSYDHVGDFIRRLTPEDVSAYAVRCLDCHRQKTNRERVA